MATRDALASTGGRGRFARSARGLACALGMTFCMVPGAALAEGAAFAQGAHSEDEMAAPMPFQLPAASATASTEPDSSGMPSLPLLLMLLSGALVAGTLSAMFHSLAQRDAAHHPAPHHPAPHHPAPSQRW